MAEDIGNPKIFSYDKKTRTATASCGISVTNDAELTLGKKGDAGQGQTLIMICPRKGTKQGRALRVNGVFNLYYSHIAGHGYMTYGLFCDTQSRGEIIGSGIESAATGLRIQTGARVAIRDLNISNCTKAIQNQTDTTIYGLRLTDVKTGAYLQSSVTFRACVFGNSSVTIADTKVPVTVTCTDCEMDRTRIAIQGEAGKNRLLIQWSQYVRLVDEQDYDLVGYYLRNTTDTDGMSSQVVKADSSGEAWLDVPECMIIRGGQTSYLNTLEINAKGTSEADYVALKRDWACSKNQGLRFIKLAGGGYEEEPAEYRKPQANFPHEIVNLCPNSSFEIETIRNFPDYWYSKNLFEVKKPGWCCRANSKKKELVFFGIDNTCAFDGTKSLLLSPGVGVRCISNFDFRDNASYAVSFYAKSDTEEGEISLGARGVFAETFEVNKEWKRYSVIWRNSDLREKKRGRTKIFFVFGNPGKSKIWLDAVMKEKGETIHPYVVDSYKKTRR